MRAIVQRVSRAAVEVDGEQVAAIGPGLVVLHERVLKNSTRAVGDSARGCWSRSPMTVR